MTRRSKIPTLEILVYGSHTSQMQDGLSFQHRVHFSCLQSELAKAHDQLAILDAQTQLSKAVVRKASATIATADRTIRQNATHRTKLQGAMRKSRCYLTSPARLARRQAAHSYRVAAIVALQRLWRLRVASRESLSFIHSRVHVVWLGTLALAVAIQAVWRGYALRKAMSTGGICKFQALYRGHAQRLPVSYANVYTSLMSSQVEVAILHRQVRLLQRALQRARGNVCPITQDTIREPVLCLSDGQQYERQALLEWVRATGTSPTTRATITEDSLVDATPAGFKALYEALAFAANFPASTIVPATATMITNVEEPTANAP